MRRCAALILLTSLLSGCQSCMDWFAPSLAVLGGECISVKLPGVSRTFRQMDARWAREELGHSGCELGTHGCLVCSTAMAATALGTPLSPKELNERLKQCDGFQPQGWLIWNAISRVTQGQLVAEYHTRPRYEVLDAALKTGAFPIIAFRLPNGARHWVLIVGKEGQDYLVRDPLDDELEKTVALSMLTNRIRAVRIVKKAL